MIAIATPVTIPNVISTDGNVMTVAVILVIIRLLVQIVIQDFQIVADAVQLLIVNIPQIMSGPGQRTSRIVGILQVRTDTLGNTGCLFAIAATSFWVASNISRNLSVSVSSSFSLSLRYWISRNGSI